MESESLFSKIQDLLGKFGGEYNIIDEQIDIQLQMEYFDEAKKLRENLNKETVLDNSEELFLEETPVGKKKEMLIALASVEKVEAFRCIERYLKDASPDMRHWAMLAYQESKMMVEGSLLEESQIMISTGMGGRGNKLRYFVAFLLAEGEVVNEFREKITRDEILYTLKKYEAEVEDLQFFDRFVCFKLLIPVSVQLQQLFEETLDNCNQFGQFLKSNYIVTNVKELSEDEVIEIIDKETTDDEDEDEDNDEFNIDLDLPNGSKS